MGSNARGSRIAEFDLDDQQKRFEASGKTAVLFCREEGIPVSTFYQRRAHWKKGAREDRTAITQASVNTLPRKLSSSCRDAGRKCSQSIR